MTAANHSVVDVAGVRLWLAAVRLALQAETLARRATAGDWMLAVLSADASMEACIGVLNRGQDALPEKGDLFPALLRRASAAVGEVGRPMRPDAVGEALAAHQMRNNVVHHGAEVAFSEADRAWRAARSLLNHVPLVLKETSELPLGAGLAFAVAKLLADNRTGGYLRAADEALALGDLKTAMENAAVALSVALSSIKPDLSPPSRFRFPLGPGLENDRTIRSLSGELLKLHAWVLPLALGATPRELSDLRSSLPRVYGEGNYGWDGVIGVQRAPELVERVTLVVFRLWEIGALPQDG